LFYNLLQSAYIVDSQWDDADELVEEMHERFPGYLFSKIAYANLLMGEDRLEEVPVVFDGKPDLNYLYPDRHVFHKTEASAFFATMCHYFIAVGNVDSADLYMNAILKYELIDMPNQTTVDKAIAGLCKLKMERLEKAGKLNLDWDDVLGGF
jgi:hypothetical protein